MQLPTDKASIASARKRPAGSRVCLRLLLLTTATLTIGAAECQKLYQNASATSPASVLFNHLNQKHGHHHLLRSNSILKDEDELAEAAIFAPAAKAATSTDPATCGGEIATNGLGSHEAVEKLGTSLSSAMLRTFTRTNNMRAYHLDLHSYRVEAKFEGDPAHIDSSSELHLARCTHHLQVYHRLLRDFRDADPMNESAFSGSSLDALRLADSFGRPAAGLLDGNQFWLGAYDNCIKLKVRQPHKHRGHPDEEREAIQSQYCVGVTQFPDWNSKKSITSLKVGLCLPETCTSSMLNENSHLFDLVEATMKFQFGADQPFSKLKLRSIYCLPHETSEARKYPLSAMLFFLVIGLTLLLCLVATSIDYLDKKMPANLKSLNRSWRTIVVESFSLIHNFEKLTNLREEEEQQVTEEGTFNRSIFFDSIAGLKCIGLLWIIAAHTFLVTPITNKNLIYLDVITKSYLANVYLTAHLMVDTFFALSGLLASYLIFKSDAIQKATTTKWIIMSVHRYFRLTPIYLLCYWFTKSVGRYMSSGPLWDYGTAQVSPRLNCDNESWWVAVLHLSDFKSPKEHCVPFAWFIANGIKFWFVTPLFLTLIYKSYRRGYAITCCAILANMALVGKLAMSSSVDMKSVIEFKPESADNMLNHMGEVYSRPYSRIGAYLVGLLAGHIIYRIDSGQLEGRLSEKTKAIVWSLFSATTIVMTFIVKLAGSIQLEDSVIPYVFGLSSALIRPLWALCTCWFVFALAQGQAKLMAKFLCAPIWRIIVKVSFCAYLAQGEVIAQLYLARSQSDSLAYSDLITRPLVTSLLTLFVSVIMVLVLEYPLIGIEELILPSKGHSSKEKPLPNDSSNGQQEIVETNGHTNERQLSTLRTKKLKYA